MGCAPNGSLSPSSNSTRSNWSSYEDEILAQVTQTLGLSDWSQITDYFNARMRMIVKAEECGSQPPRRSIRQCRERYTNQLDPSLNKCPWTHAEDEKLLMLQKQMGNKWSEISKVFHGRTHNGVKNRLHSLLRSRKRPSPSSSSSFTSYSSRGWRGAMEASDVPTIPSQVPVSIPQLNQLFSMEHHQQQHSSSSSSSESSSSSIVDLPPVPELDIHGITALFDAEDESSNHATHQSQARHQISHRVMTISPSSYVSPTSTMVHPFVFPTFSDPHPSHHHQHHRSSSLSPQSLPYPQKQKVSSSGPVTSPLHYQVKQHQLRQPQPSTIPSSSLSSSPSMVVVGIPGTAPHYHPMHNNRSSPSPSKLKKHTFASSITTCHKDEPNHKRPFQMMHQLFHAYADPKTKLLNQAQLLLLLNLHRLKQDTAPLLSINELPPSLSMNNTPIDFDAFSKVYQVCNRCTQMKQKNTNRNVQTLVPVIVRIMPTTFEGPRVRSCEHFQWTWCQGHHVTGNAKCNGTNRHDKCPKYLANCTLWKHRLPPKARKDRTVVVQQPPRASKTPLEHVKAEEEAEAEEEPVVKRSRLTPWMMM